MLLLLLVWTDGFMGSRTGGVVDYLCSTIIHLAPSPSPMPALDSVVHLAPLALGGLMAPLSIPKQI
jgi:hypothetical protein